MLVSDVFQENLMFKCIISCLIVMKNFMQKYACIAEVPTKVTGATFYVHPVHWWRLGVVVSVVGRINEVNQHRARLVHDG